MKGFLDVLILAGLVALFLLLVNLADHRHPGNNPDQWFHVGVSHLEAQNGVMRRLPEAQDLGWSDGFPDQASLFHAATTVGWKVGGAEGVIDVSLLLGSLVIIALYLICRRGADEWVSALAVAAGVLANPFVVFRLGMVRPEGLALFCLLLLVVGMRNRSWESALVAAVAFALASQAVYLPVLLAAGSIGLGLLRRGKPDPSRAIACGGGTLTGLAMGAAVCPNNPWAWKLTWEEWIHPLPAASAELQSPGFEPYLHLFGAALLLAVFATALLAGTRWRSKGTPEEVRDSEAPLLLAGVGLVLVAGAFFWPRLALFGIPLSAPGIAGAIQGLSARARLAALAGLLLVPAPALVAEFTAPADLHQGVFVDDLQKAIQAIPAGAELKKVFNCDFHYGDYLLALRPDLRFVDALEPTLLQRASPTKYLARRQALQGKSDPLGTIQQVFQADYVLCAVPPLDEVLDLDPRAKKLFSAKGSGISLYEF